MALGGSVSALGVSARTGPLRPSRLGASRFLLVILERMPRGIDDFVLIRVAAFAGILRVTGLRAGRRDHLLRVAVRMAARTQKKYR